MDKWIVYTKMTHSSGLRDSVAQAVAVVLHGALGQTYKSAPTVIINLMAQAVTFER